MHHFAALLMVSFINTVGADKPDDFELLVPDGGFDTEAQCYAAAQSEAADIFTMDGVLGVTIKCVDMPESQGI